GVITQTQQEFISKLLRFDDLKASDIMIPMSQVVSIPKSLTVREAMRVFGQSGHRRLPIVDVASRQEGGVGQTVIGALYIRDAAVAFINGYAESSVSELCEPVAEVAKDTNLADTLALMQKRGAQVAVVKDSQLEVGFVFLNDLLEEILGETFGQKRLKISGLGPQLARK
ncbi:MAG: CBS domain-containing protein, partial [Thermoprotei archaeon]